MLSRGAEVMRSLSNLYKQRNIIAENQGTRIIDPNVLLAMRLEAQKKLWAQQHPEEQPPEPEEPEIDLEAIRAEAEQIRQDARLKADEMVEKALGQVEEIRGNAETEGWQKGYADGKKKAAEEQELEQQKLEQYQQELEEKHQQRMQELEGQVLEAVCDVMEQVFHVQFDQFGPILLHLVKQAMQQIEGARDFTVRVHPNQYGYLQEHWQELAEQLGSSLEIRLEADISLAESGCVIETDSGFFDCSLDVQFANLIKAVRMLSV